MPTPEIVNTIKGAVTKVAQSPSVKLTATVTAMVAVTGAAVVITHAITKAIDGIKAEEA